MLRRYPVKSMLGEDVPATDVTGKGLAHDRGLALVHRETGKVASAKNPRLWRGMLKLSAAVDPGSAVESVGVAGVGVAATGVRITLPDGKTVFGEPALSRPPATGPNAGARVRPPLSPTL